MSIYHHLVVHITTAIEQGQSLPDWIMLPADLYARFDAEMREQFANCAVGELSWRICGIEIRRQLTRLERQTPSLN